MSRLCRRAVNSFDMRCNNCRFHCDHKDRVRKCSCHEKADCLDNLRNDTRGASIQVIDEDDHGSRLGRDEVENTFYILLNKMEETKPSLIVRIRTQRGRYRVCIVQHRFQNMHPWVVRLSEKRLESYRSVSPQKSSP